MSLEAELRGFGGRTLASASELHHADLKAINDRDAERVKPAANATAALEGDTLRAVLKPQSWNVFVLA